MEKTIVINVGGMHCVNCAKTIETALSALDGVQSISVSVVDEKVSVVVDSNAIGVDDLKKAVQKCGFQFLGADGQTDREKVDEKKKRLLRSQIIKFSVGFVTGCACMVMGTAKTGISPHGLMIAQFAVSSPVFFFVSSPVFKAAYMSIRRLNLTMDVMYAMGMGVSYAASVMAMLGVLLPPEFMFFDTAVLLAAFLTLGRYLEALARSRTTSAIRSLMDLRPKRAIVVVDGRQKETPLEAVVAGDVLMVLPGDAVPVDGRVLSGESYVDESMVSGEAFPVIKKTNDGVIGGTMNTTGTLTIRAEKVGAETLLSQIIRLVQQAQVSKPPIQKAADRAVGWFIPVVFVVALLTFFVWRVAAQWPLVFALSACISVVVVACPCALGLATPVALAVGLGRAAKLGILIKNGDALELLEKIAVVVFDKTGTLTVGSPMVTDVVALSGNEERLLALAASVERNSRHPLAKAICQQASDRQFALMECRDANTIVGRGVTGIIDGKETLVGSRALFLQRGIPINPEAQEELLKRGDEGKNVVLVGQDGRLLGIIACFDTLRGSSQKAVAALQAMHIDTVMMSGDNEKTATAIAGQAGISTVFAGILPSEKAARVKQLQEQKGRVAFVGDGINDAVALAQADIGIAMGVGTDVAIESADIVLMHDDCLDVAASLELGKAVMSRIRLNIFWAIAYNAALVPFAAGLTYPLFQVLIRPQWAGLAMAASSLTVVLLSLGLKRFVPSAAMRAGS